MKTKNNLIYVLMIILCWTIGALLAEESEKGGKIDRTINGITFGATLNSLKESGNLTDFPVSNQGEPTFTNYFGIGEYKLGSDVIYDIGQWTGSPVKAKCFGTDFYCIGIKLAFLNYMAISKNTYDIQTNETKKKLECYDPKKGAVLIGCSLEVTRTGGDDNLDYKSLIEYLNNRIGVYSEEYKPSKNETTIVWKDKDTYFWKLICY